MDYFQSREYLSDSRYISGRISKNLSSGAMAVILVAHVLVILLLLNDKAAQHELIKEKTFQVIRVIQEPEQAIAEPQRPDLPRLPTLQAIVPDIQFSESISSSLNFPLNEPYQRQSESSDGYENVFDPKVRQKLLNSKILNRPRAREKSKTWTAIDGRTFVEMGDGVCMVSMANVDSRDRATNWGLTNCGKDNSEKAMDRVMADVESRKAPPGKLNSSP